MRLLFIRHAEAVDRDAFQGEDLKRPLTEAGRKEAKRAYKVLSRIYRRPELVLTSEAVRSKATAEIVCSAFRKLSPRVTPLLNPGAGVRGFRKLLAELPDSLESIFVVGHEPDMSRIISQICASGELDIRIKKGSCVDVQLDHGFRGELLASLPLTVLSAQRGRRV